MRKGIVMAVLTVLPTVGSTADLGLGLTAGASLLNQSDTSLSHGPLRDEVVLGPTALIGVVVDLGFGGRDHVTFEAGFGPYGNDGDFYCILSFGAPDCIPAPLRPVSHVRIYGLYYSHLFGSRTWKPLVGVGCGVKEYWYEEEDYGYSQDSSEARAAVSFVAGAERGVRNRLRLEARVVLVPDNPLYQYSKHQIELQARVAFLFAVGR